MSRAGGAYVLLTGPPSLMFHKERGPSLPTWGPCSAPQGRAKVARLAPVLKAPLSVSRHHAGSQTYQGPCIQLETPQSRA